MLVGVQVPDILLEGIPVAKIDNSIVTAFRKGFIIYLKDSGYVGTILRSKTHARVWLQSFQMDASVSMQVRMDAQSRADCE